MPIIPGGFGTGVVLGAGALLLAPVVLPNAKRYLRCAAKSVVKGGLIASHSMKKASEEARRKARFLSEKIRKEPEEAKAEARVVENIISEQPASREAEATVASAKPKASRKSRKKAKPRPRLKDSLSH